MKILILHGATLRPLGIDDISFMPNPWQISMAHANLTDPDRPHRFREPDRMSETQHYGGAGLRGSPASFLKLLRALLRGGELDGTRILKAETVDSMYRNQMRPGSQQRSLEEYVRKNISFTSGNGYGLGGALDGARLASEGVGDELTWSGVAVSDHTFSASPARPFSGRGYCHTTTDIRS